MYNPSQISHLVIALLSSMTATHSQNYKPNILCGFCWICQWHNFVIYYEDFLIVDINPFLLQYAGLGCSCKINQLWVNLQKHFLQTWLAPNVSWMWVSRLKRNPSDCPSLNVHAQKKFLKWSLKTWYIVWNHNIFTLIPLPFIPTFIFYESIHTKNISQTQKSIFAALVTHRYKNLAPSTFYHLNFNMIIKVFTYLHILKM